FSGNLVIAPGDDWIDYEAAGVSGPAELDRRLLTVIKAVGLHEDVYRLGLLGRLDDEAGAALHEKLVVARRALADRLHTGDLERFVEPFHPDRYNANASIGENLLFGVMIDGNVTDASLAADPQFRSALADTGLVEPLLAIGRK